MTIGIRLIGVHQFADHDRHRPAVDDDVVKGPDKAVFMFRAAEQVESHQWRLIKGKVFGAISGEEVENVLFAFGFRKLLQF